MNITKWINDIVDESYFAGIGCIKKQNHIIQVNANTNNKFSKNIQISLLLSNYLQNRVYIIEEKRFYFAKFTFTLYISFKLLTRTIFCGYNKVCFHRKSKYNHKIRGVIVEKIEIQL